VKAVLLAGLEAALRDESVVSLAKTEVRICRRKRRRQFNGFLHPDGGEKDLDEIPLLLIDQAEPLEFGGQFDEGTEIDVATNEG